MHILPQVLRSTLNTLHALTAAVSATFKSRAALQLENLAIRHQLGVLQRSVERPKLVPADRLVWGHGYTRSERLAVCFGHRQTGHRHRLAPQGLSSVLDLEGPPRSTGAAGGSQKRSRTYPQLSRQNPLWGAPRIHGELLKLGIDIGDLERELPVAALVQRFADRRSPGRKSTENERT